MAHASRADQAEAYRSARTREGEPTEGDYARSTLVPFGLPSFLADDAWSRAINPRHSSSGRHPVSRRFPHAHLDRSKHLALTPSWDYCGGRHTSMSAHA